MATDIIVANGEAIRVFRADGAARMVEREHFANPMRWSTQANTGLDRVASPPWRRRAQQNRYMARVLAAYLKQACDDGEARVFGLAAPAQLLRVLHTLLGDAKHLLTTIVAKDLVEADYETLVAGLQPQRSRAAYRQAEMAIDEREDAPNPRDPTVAWLPARLPARAPSARVAAQLRGATTATAQSHECLTTLRTRRGRQTLN